MIEKIGHAKKTEVLTEVFTKLSYVLILDLPDFIQDFVLDLKNKMDDEIKKMLDQAAKDNQDVDEFEVLKWLLDTIDVAPEETEEVKKHQHKEVFLYDHLRRTSQRRYARQSNQMPCDRSSYILDA